MAARKLEIEYERASGGDRAKATVRDASLGGLFIETKAPFENGALVTLELTSPGGMKIVVDARVIAVQAKDLGPDKPSGMAVRFLDLPDGAAGTLGPMFQASRPPARTYLGVGSTEVEVPKAPSLPKMASAPQPAAPRPPPPAPAPPPPSTPLKTKTPEMPIPPSSTRPAAPPVSGHQSFPPQAPPPPPQRVSSPPLQPYPSAPPLPIASVPAPRGTNPVVWIAIAVLVVGAIAGGAYAVRTRIGAALSPSSSP